MKKIIIYIILPILLLVAVILLNGLLVTLTEDNLIKSPEYPENTLDYKDDCLDNDDIFCSHLPIVKIETNNQYIDIDVDIWTDIIIIDQPNQNNHIDDLPTISSISKIKLRGDSSYRTFDKMQYRIIFYKDAEKDKKRSVSVMGMDKASSWVLNGPFMDRSLIRNRLIYGAASKLNLWSPETRYCELFLNDEYMGLFLMIDPIINKANRELNDFGLIAGQTPYVLERDRNGNEKNEILTYGLNNFLTSYPLSIAYPRPSNLTDRQLDWIISDINEFEEALYSDYFANPEFGYAKYIDIDSFVDFYLINEFSMMTDAGYLSTFVHKNLGGKLKFALWDCNNAFDNYATHPEYYDTFIVNKTNWFNRLLQDRLFVDKVVQRYHYLREGVLSEERLLNNIDDNIEYLGDSIDRNFDVWGYTFYGRLLVSDKDGNSRDPKSYEEAVIMLKDTIINRGNFLDNNIEDLYKDCIN